MEPSSSQEQDASRQLLATLYLLFSLGYILWMVWAMLPDHRKTEICMRLLRSSARVTSRLARHAGVASMSRELATGCEQYAVPYWLSRRVLALDRAYDRARDVSS